MNILCLISSGPGHLDLGGNGFTKTLSQLQKNNKIQVLSTQAQCDELSSRLPLKPEVYPFELINWLMLPVEEHEMYQLHESLFLNLKMIELKIKSINPDLVLVDRILGQADPLLKFLSIPYISVGTNGLPWIRHNGYSLEQAISIHNKNGFRTKLYGFLGWPKTTLSAWSISSDLNLCFLDDSFYPKSNKKCHYIRMFRNDLKLNKQQQTVGISLGSGTYDLTEFRKKLSAVLSIVPEDVELEVYGSEKKWKLLTKGLIITTKMRYLGYVDFNERCRNITHLIFAGGIGTLWNCIQYEVIPIIISGNVHDQDYNAKMINRKLDVFISNVFESAEKYKKGLKDIKKATGYTHSLSKSVTEIDVEFRLDR